ncbi:uncharacterized protein NEPG_01818 [Nematocida parisii ERTm1]|uniref:uncharacterized protein n=1 Tax=Nematocida parisii (strain ERTm1 / ATCC PRA-289) TaxID=881290 RepID=UPI000264B7E5|nr:uncharacterized protein NEPG_01818 [Nematocida parisii ERTm1]EIJ93476.1 hypothetical protein NEPG_01818 [Nematocida parisii ERTm1]|eukprot:XP_013059646.1 hypothetical protein NEPG_01818 [Nematocida parisii ERTm1]
MNGLHDIGNSTRIFWLNNIICIIGMCISIYGLLDISHTNYFNVKMNISIKKFFFITNSTLLFSFISFLMTLITQYTDKFNIRVISAHITSTVLSSEILIFLIFWPIFVYNPNLVFPKSSLYGDTKITLFSNLCMHAFPCLLLFISYILNNTLITPGYTYILYYTAYTIIISCIYKYINGYYRYNILNKYNKYIIIVPIISYIMIYMINSIIYIVKIRVRQYINKSIRVYE